MIFTRHDPWRLLLGGMIFAGALAGTQSAVADDRLGGDCPADYQVKPGLNVGFPSDGKMRAFVVVPPADLSKPAPVWVPLTGTVESTNQNLQVPRSGANALLADKGYMVIGPVRECADQDPDRSGEVCNGLGHDGWQWRPWNDGRAPDAAGERFKTDEGPDSRFLVSMVRCVAKFYPLDKKRLYVGGISSGGTLTNRALTFRSDFWAGGMPISGEWYVIKDDGSSMTFENARDFVAANPTKIFQSRVAPYPLPSKLNPMIVITVWGGEKDKWSCSGVPCSDYRPTTQAASNYYGSQKNVIEVSCTSSHGHMWPQINTQDFNLWALNTLSSHPKGSNPGSFHLTTPPDGYSCKLGPFTDHY